MNKDANPSMSFRLDRNQNDNQKNSILESQAPQNDSHVIVIAGPTASGKTAMAIDLAEKIDGEIINADSRSVYKEMNIGTGKPTEKEMKGIPHHLFDIVNPDETFSVAEYKNLAEVEIIEIQKRGKVPIIVGGSGLYIDALVYKFSLTEMSVDQDLRNSLSKKTKEELFEELSEKDPESAKIIDKNNKRRLERALEIYYQTWSSKSSLDKKKSKSEEFLYFAIDIEREELYKKINKRVEEMFLNGLIKETEELSKKYKVSPTLKTLGYEESLDYLNSKISLQEAITKTQQAHRNLAKRQMTWFKKNKDIVWIKDLSGLKKYL